MFKRRSNSRYWVNAKSVIVGLFAVAGIWGCHSKREVPHGDRAQNGQPAEVEVPVTVSPVEVRSVQRRVAVVGTLNGFERITVTPKVEGRIQTINFDVGDRVAPGSILLELDPTDYRLAVEEAQQSINEELAKLDLQTSPATDFDIEQLPGVESARLLYTNGQQKFERQRTLLGQNAGSGQMFEQAETEMKVAAAALRLARVNARTTLAAIKHREAILTLAKQKLSDSQVTAPKLTKGMAESEIDFVVSKRMSSIGEMVRAFPSTPVFELVADHLLKLHVMIPERFISQVKLGLTVEVTVDAYPGEVFPGKVARINPTIDAQSRSFDVEAHIPNHDHRLRHGGFAKADVIVAVDDEALTVPLEAVTRFAGVSKVFKIANDTAQEAEITIGTQGAGWVEVTGSIQSTDKVVTSGQSRLANGTKVTIREPLVKTAGRE